MDSLTFYGSIPPQLIQKTLLWGSLKGILGLILLPFGGLFFICGLLLIAWGLIPYRNLKRLETSPPTLTVTEEGLTYRLGKTSTHFRLQDIRYKDNTLFIQNTPLPFFSEKTYLQLQSLLNDNSLQ